MELTDEDDGDAEDLSAALASLRLRQPPNRKGGDGGDAAEGGLVGSDGVAVGRVVTQVRYHMSSVSMLLRISALRGQWYRHLRWNAITWHRVALGMNVVHL